MKIFEYFSEKKLSGLKLSKLTDFLEPVLHRYSQYLIDYEPMTDPDLFDNQLTNLGNYRLSNLLKYKFRGSTRMATQTVDLILECCRESILIYTCTRPSALWLAPIETLIHVVANVPL